MKREAEEEEKGNVEEENQDQDRSGCARTTCRKTLKMNIYA